MYKHRIAIIKRIIIISTRIMMIRITTVMTIIIIIRITQNNNIN